LKHSDIDVSIKDFEGYTAYDLYNSSVRFAQPTANEEVLAELFTWGTNRCVNLYRHLVIMVKLTWSNLRNAALGLGDANDRAYPDQVIIPSKDNAARRYNKTLDERLAPVQVRQVSMSKLHTGMFSFREMYVCRTQQVIVVLTSEPRDNIRVCGFGSGGR